MPSHGEGFGIVFFEALACGVPVSGSKVSGAQSAQDEVRCRPQEDFRPVRGAAAGVQHVPSSPNKYQMHGTR
jgi:glycosyltransferase involved in cell wall biosynthesis